MSDETDSPLNAHDAADALGALFGDDDHEQQDGEAETPEAAAERLAAREAAGETGDEQTDEEEGQVDPEKVEIEVDGKPVLLTKAELAEHYKNGLRQKDYTQKTMEVAETRKVAEAEQATARAQRDEYAYKLNTFVIQTEGGLQNIVAQMTDELLTTDPVGYMQLERTLKQGQANLAQAQQERAAIHQQQQMEQANSQRDYQSKQLEEIQAKLPEWKDQAKAKAESEKIKTYLKANGFSDAKISNIVDAADVLVQRKAMLYDELIERAGKAVKKVSALPAKVERPGTAAASGKSNGLQDAMKRLNKSGSMRDAAEAFTQFLG